MAIKTFNPTTPSRRNMTVLNYQGLSKVKPEKSLLEKVKKTAGRNSYGRITVRHIGGGNKKKYRIIDFKRQKLDVFAEVKTIEYDPNRSANIALIQYFQRLYYGVCIYFPLRRCIIIPVKLKIVSFLINSQRYSVFIKDLPSCAGYVQRACFGRAYGLTELIPFYHLYIKQVYRQNHKANNKHSRSNIRSVII